MRTDAAAGCYYLPLVSLSPSSATVTTGQTFQLSLEVYYAEYGCDLSWAGHIGTDASGHFGPQAYTSPSWGSAGTYTLTVSCGGLGGTEVATTTVNVVAGGGGGGGGGGGLPNSCSENTTSMNYATYIGQSGVPDTLTVGQQFTASITFRNDGACPWTAANSYRAGTENPENSTDFGTARLYLDPGDVISTGQSKTFTATFTAPTTAGSYGWGWRMLREYINWFGTPTNGSFKTITVTGTVPPQPPPPPDTCTPGIDPSCAAGASSLTIDPTFLDAQRRTCRVAHGWVQYATLAGNLLWRYHQDIRWCWSGQRISLIFRNRWAEIGTVSPWSFDGHQSNSCNSETCGELAPRFGPVQMSTGGKFHACTFVVILCSTHNPNITMQINPGGGSTIVRWNS